ncbi:MAG: NAD-binding protein [Halobacteriota archaeon]|nr:NAD-binding protein [Halobacteriota archaeon]
MKQGNLFERITSPFYFAAIILASIILIGPVGYVILEDWDFLTALFFVVSTVTTVGYGNIVPSNHNSEIYTMFIMLSSMSTVLIAFGTYAQNFIRRTFKGIDVMEEMEKRIKDLDDHIVIAMTGNLSRIVINEFIKKEMDFVVVSKDSEFLKDLDETGILYVEGSPDFDEVLMEANIKNANGMIIALEDDVKNVFVALSAKKLNPHIKIVAEAKEANTISKLKYSGVDEVLIPDQITGIYVSNKFSKQQGQKEMPKIIETMKEVKSTYTCEERPTLGSEINISLFRALNTTLHDLSPNAGKILYSMGENFGKNVLAPLIESTDFERVLKDLGKEIEDANIGIFKMVKVEENFAVIRLDECIFCAGLEDVGKTLCDFDSGLIAGVLQRKLGKIVSVEEVKCWGKGDDTCEFEINITME